MNQFTKYSYGYTYVKNWWQLYAYTYTYVCMYMCMYIYICALEIDTYIRYR